LELPVDNRNFTAPTPFKGQDWKYKLGLLKKADTTYDGMPFEKHNIR